jgi:chemotaxis response regulator CheB
MPRAEASGVSRDVPAIRCLIVDDEPLPRERLRTLLANHPDAQVAAARSPALRAPRTSDLITAAT